MLPETAQKLQPYAHSILTNTATEKQLAAFANSERSLPVAMTSAGDVTASYVVNTNTNSWNYVGFANAPEGSIAIIPIKGVLMKTDWCGEFGTMNLARVVRDAANSPNIAAILLCADGPGGQVYGTGTLADAVKDARAQKPVFAHVEEGMAASATYWSIINAVKIYLSRGTDMVGSIGVYQTIADYRGMYEKEGIKVIDVYSSKSPEKNMNWRKAFDENDLTKLVTELDFIDDVFMGAVRAARGTALNEDALKGDMYYAENAISMGLADGIMSLESTINELFNRSKGSLTIG